MKFKNDVEAFQQCNPDHRWIFNKLEVAKRLGHEANPISVPIPRDGLWCVRPVLNLEGMGAHAYIDHFYKDQIIVDHPSHFWHEYFTGHHVSVDFYKGDVINACIGLRDNDKRVSDLKLWKWTEWRKVKPEHYSSYHITADFIDRFRRTFKNILNSYDYLNVEMIGGNIVEVHLRPDPYLDLWRENEIMIPVWTDKVYNEVKLSEDGFKFVEAHDDAGGYLITHRKGFWVK